MNTSEHHERFDAAYLVTVLDLRVMVTEEEGCWFAQGLEVDYAQSLDTETDALVEIDAKGIRPAMVNH